jgi:hypothetical protein
MRLGREVQPARHHPHQLERLCRYFTRPPIPQSRLRELADGRIALDLKRPRRGVRSFVFESVALGSARIAVGRRFCRQRDIGAQGSGSADRNNDRTGFRYPGRGSCQS